MTRDEVLKIVAEARAKGWAPDLRGSNLRGSNLSGSNLSCSDLRGAYLSGSNLDGANLVRANLADANLDGANVKISFLEVFTGLYRYTCWAFVSVEGVPWVRMGCLWKTVEDWDSIGIRNSNPREFPDDGSEKSERRVLAFDFTRSAALALAKRTTDASPH